VFLVAADIVVSIYVQPEAIDRRFKSPELIASSFLFLSFILKRNVIKLSHRSSIALLPIYFSLCLSSYEIGYYKILKNLVEQEVMYR
jgi:hypothetical protein